MSDTIRTPDPVPPRKGGDSDKGTIRPPTSWVETARPSSTPSTDATIVAPSAVEDFPEEVRPHALDANRQMNQYILVKVLGKGGMGEVWKAWDRKLSRWAAIKFLLGESQEGVARFKREAKMAARLSHPNIAPVHEVGEAPSRQPGQPSCHFLAMEYIDGTTLGGAKLSLRDRVDVFVKVAQGIEAAHKGGVVHRDIKPANIMLTKENWPYVMDFGLAKSLDGDNNLSATGAVMGTPAFMPPEQVEGKLDEIGPRSDVYSLGATMYAVFCGAHPFVAQTTLQLLQKVCNEAPPPPRQKNPEIPAELEAIILKAMAKKQEDRFPSSAAAAEALRKVLVRIDAAADAGPAQAPSPPPPPVAAAKSPVLWPVFAALFLLLAGGAGAAIWYFRSSPKAEPKVVADAVAPKPVAEVKPESKVEAKPLVKVEPRPETKVEPKPEPKPETKVEPRPEIKPEPRPEANPGPKPDLKPEPVIVKEPAAKGEQVAQRGIDYLVAHYKQGEFSTDSDYWAAYALLQAPVPALQKKIVEFLKGAAWQQSAHGTAAAAVRALGLAASGDGTLRVLSAECAQYLVEAQGPNGLWADATEVPVHLDDPKRPEMSAFIVSGDAGPKRYEIVRKGSARNAPDGDLATTSLALLALSAAESCGHRVPADTWKRAYAAIQPWSAANNALGAVSSVLCRRALGEPEAGQDIRVQTALKEISVPEKGASIALLLAIERVGGLFATPRLGGQDWYGAGTKTLAAAQQPDGSWTENGDPVLGTSRALLFFSRSTAALQAGLKRGGAGRLEMKSLGGCTNLMFVLDASGNMRQELGNRERFDVAKESIAKIVEKLPDGAIAGLRVFGNRRLAVEAGAEIDSSLITPPGPVNRRQLVTHMQSLKVKGRSPLTFTLIQTAQDLAPVPADVEMAIVLLIDGTDMERKADPVPATGDLAASRRGLKVHVVGFNTDDDDIQDRMKRMADAGGGRYIAARDEKTLLAQLTAATIGEQDYTVLNQNGDTVAQGRLGDSRELPEGRYTIVCGKQQEKIWINPGLATRVIVSQEKLAATK